MTQPTSDEGLSGQSLDEGGARTARWAFIRTESGSATVLLAATLAALAWANIDADSYASLWHTHLSVRLGDSGVSLDLREWVNSGLMTLFFFVVGLEARREFDMGELRERRRLTLPLLAGLSGMAVPVLIYLAINAGESSAHGWGAAMSTDTAFALGMLALLGSRFPRRLHTFILTVAVVDDFVALVVIAVAYSDDIDMPALMIALAMLVVIVLVRAAKVRRGSAYGVLGVITWVAVLKSGVDPVVVGLVMGLLTFAYPASRAELSGPPVCSARSANSPHRSWNAPPGWAWRRPCRRTSASSACTTPGPAM